MEFLKKFILFYLIINGRCDDCLSVCDCEIESATCYFLTRFPEFRSTSWISVLYIFSSDITKLGIYGDNFPYLNRLVLTNCRFVKCSEIKRIRDMRPRIRLIYDEQCIEDFTSSAVSVDFSQKLMSRKL